MSRLIGLTLHEQRSNYPTVTTLDLTLTEGIVRAIDQLMDVADAIEPKLEHGPSVNPGIDSAAYRIVDRALDRYGGPFADKDRNWHLINWLIEHGDGRPFRP